MKYTVLPFLAATALLAACQTSPKPGSPAAKIEAVQQAKEEQAEVATETASNIPDWCLSPPQDINALYACGIGNQSMSLRTARTSANLDAKNQLADAMEGKLSSLTKEFQEAVGTGSNERVQQEISSTIKNVVRETNLAGYTVLQTDAQSINGKYQVYVLVEYPLGEANRALSMQLQQNEIISTQESADDAFAELNAEIEKMK